MSRINDGSGPGLGRKMIGRPAGAGRWPRAAAVPAMLAAWAVGLGAPALATGKAPQQADAAPALPASEVAVPRPASAPAEPPVPAPSPDPAPAPADPEPAGSPAVRLAAGLLDTIPPGARLALRPLDPRESRLPQEDGARLYEEVLNAIVRAAAGRGVAVLARERLHEVYGTLEEFYQGDVESMLRAAQADVEVICKASPVADGVNLSCGAVDLVGTVTVAHAMARFPLERNAAPYSHAVAEIARRLVDGAPAVGPVERVMLMDVSIGARGDLGVYLGQRLEGEVVRQFAERARREGDEARVAAVLGTAPDTSGEVPRYRLAGDLWRLDDDRVRLEVRLRHRGRSLVAAGADIATSSLPPRLAARSGAGGSPGRMYEAVAEAVVSERLDRAAAVRAARNLARARVVAQALGRPPPGVTEVRSEADAVMSFEGFLDAGIPVDEGFGEAVPEGEDGGGQRVALRLAARVAPIGRVIRPAVSARLDRTVYRALEPIRVELRSEEAAHLGLFAWGADNRVVRLYPRERDRLVIGAGETLVLPRRGEGRILSAPLPVPGNREDHEAFVVVASPSPINFAAMARAAGASLSDTMSQSVEGSRFLAALAGQDPARMAVIWLPYQVHD